VPHLWREIWRNICGEFDAPFTAHVDAHVDARWMKFWHDYATNLMRSCWALYVVLPHVWRNTLACLPRRLVCRDVDRQLDV
jgi:hypothetical protein